MGLQGKYKPSIPGMWGNTTVHGSWVQTFLGKLRCSSGRHEELHSLILHIFPRHRYWAGSYQKAFISVTVVCIQPSLMQRTSDVTLSTLHSSTAMVITTAITTSEDYGASLSHFPQITRQTDAPHWAWFSRRVLTLKRCFPSHRHQELAHSEFSDCCGSLCIIIRSSSYNTNTQMCDLALYKPSGKKSCFTQHYQPFNCISAVQLNGNCTGSYVASFYSTRALQVLYYSPHVFLQKCYFTLWWIHRRETWG